MAGILLSGCNGKMGRAVTLSVADNCDCEIVGGIDVFDEARFGYPVFSSPAVVTKDIIDKTLIIICFVFSAL